MPLKVMDSQRMPQGSCLVVHNTRDEGRGTHWTGPIWSKINLASVSSLSLKPAQSPLMTSITSSLTLPVDYLQLLFYFFSPHSCWNVQRPSRFPMLSKPASYQECSIFLFTLHFCKAVLKTCTRSNDHQARLGMTGKCPYCVFNLSAMGPSSSVNAYVSNGFIFS